MYSCRSFSAFVKKLSNLLSLIDVKWLRESFNKSLVFSLSIKKNISCTERAWSSGSQLRSSGKEAITDAAWMSFLFCKIKTSLREGGRKPSNFSHFQADMCSVFNLSFIALVFSPQDIYM